MSNLLQTILGTKTEAIKTEIRETRNTQMREQLKDCEVKFKLALNGQGDVNQTKFDFAWCLVHQREKHEIRLGGILFSELANVSAYQRDALYYLALSQYLQNEYGDSRETLHKLLAIDPKNRQGLDLKALVEEELSKDGALGIAVVGSAVAAAVVVGTMLLKLKK